MMENRSAVKNGMQTTLIAPCGMNCRLCMAYGRKKKACPGCRGEGTNKAKTCAGCKIKNCELLAHSHSDYCFSCDNYPCDRIKHIDKRYRTKYGMSMVEKLKNLQKVGINQFIQNEAKKWSCPQCGEIICVHYPDCRACGYVWR